MKGNRKPRLVYLHELQKSRRRYGLEALESAEFRDQFSDAGTLDRLSKNLKYIKETALHILKEKGIDSHAPLILSTEKGNWTDEESRKALRKFKAEGKPYAFDWQMDAQATLAKDAYFHAVVAEGHVSKGDFLRAADESLNAAYTLQSSILQAHVKPNLRKRRGDTDKRSAPVVAAWKEHHAQRGWYPRGKYALELANSALRKAGQKEFITDGAFRKWRTKANVQLPS